MSGSSHDLDHHHERPRTPPSRAGVAPLAARPRTRVVAGREEAGLQRGRRPHRQRVRGGHRPAQRRQGRRTGLGRSRATGSGSWPTGRRPSRSWASAASICRWSRTRPACTTSSCARSAPAIRTRSSGCRPSGTSRSSTARGRCASRGWCCASSASTCPRHGDPHLGLERRAALPGAARAARRHRAPERGRAGGAGHARLDDRCGAGEASGRRGPLTGRRRDGSRPQPGGRRHDRRGSPASQERRAGLRRGLAGPHLRHDGGDEPRSPLRVARVPGPADRRDRARGARGRAIELLRALAPRLRAACSSTRACSTPSALAERTHDFESGRRDDVF